MSVCGHNCLFITLVNKSIITISKVSFEDITKTPGYTFLEEMKHFGQDT